MLPPEYPYIHYRKLETIFERCNTREKINVCISVVITIAIGNYWREHIFNVFPIIGTLLFTYTVFYLMITRSHVAKAKLISQVDNDKLRPYTAKEIKEIIREVSKDFQEQEIPHCYFVNRKIGMALTLNASIINNIKRWNAIYLDRYILKVCNRDELKALIAHEMAHFSIYMSFWNRYFYLFACMYSVWMTTASCYVLEIVWRSTGSILSFWFLLVFFSIFGIVQFVWKLVFVIVSVFASLFMRRDSQVMESLCDYEAARRYGLLPMINVLLKVGSRIEIFEIITSRISPQNFRFRNLENFKEYDEKQEIEKSIEHKNIEKKLLQAMEKFEEDIPEGFITPEEVEAYIQQAIESADIEDTSFRRKGLINWLDFDTNIADRRIDKEEFPRLLEEIKKHPNKPLFYIPEEIDPHLASNADHPSLRKRILFLAYNCGHRMK